MTAQRRLEVVDYNPRWPQDFATVRDTLAAALGALAVAIEHVGSTAVPGLAAKPIIDMDVVIASRDLLPEVVTALAELGYAHEGDGGIPGREAFRLEDDAQNQDPPRHHLYVCAQDSAELARHLALRDFLRAHPGRAVAYGQLKRELAERFPYDSERYVKGKSAFIEAIYREAAQNGSRP